MSSVYELVCWKLRTDIWLLSGGYSAKFKTTETGRIYLLLLQVYSMVK